MHRRCRESDSSTMDARDKSRTVADAKLVAGLLAAVVVAGGLLVGFSLLVVTLLT